MGPQRSPGGFPQSPDHSAEDRAPAPAEYIRELANRFCDVREATEKLCDTLSPEDAVAQSMPDASPAKWHLAHTTWFFETFVLEPNLPDYCVFHPDFRVLFNSYYNTVGEQHPRPERGLLTRPSYDEVIDYRAHVDQHVAVVLQKEGLPLSVAKLIDLGLHHEQQHQELMLTDVKHLFSCNALHPAFADTREAPSVTVDEADWYRFEEGLYDIGHEGDGFAFDSEGPRNRQFVAAFEIASRPVSNGEFLAFIADGGYRTPALWLSDGWAVVQREGWTHPLYWHESEEGWVQFTLGGDRALRLDEPICHLSYYEADAYARWAGARLPTEIEWEIAAARAEERRGNFAESGVLHPVPIEASQFFGNVWEWTASPYVPYPGYAPPAGAVGEYNGKFMVNQMVLRGGSCATPRSHIRLTYRNFFFPDARWQFSGMRLAWTP